MDKVHRELLRRSRAAVAEAERQRTRATELSAFVQALQATAPAELVRCAWCGRVRAGSHWVDPTQPFAHAVIEPAHGVAITSATLTDGTGDEGTDWAAAEVTRQRPDERRRRR